MGKDICFFVILLRLGDVFEQNITFLYKKSQPSEVGFDDFIMYMIYRLFISADVTSHIYIIYSLEVSMF